MHLLEVYFDGSSDANMSPAGGGVTTAPWLAAVCVIRNHGSLLNVTCPEGHSPTIQCQYGPLCILIYLILSLGLFMLLRVYWDENFCVNTCPYFPSLPIGSANLCNVLGHPYHIASRKVFLLTAV